MEREALCVLGFGDLRGGGEEETADSVGDPARASCSCAS